MSTQSQTTAKIALPGSISRRVLLCAAWFTVTCLVFLAPLSQFVRYALSNDNASHAILIPAISIWILYLERERIFTPLGSGVGLASLFFVAGCLSVGRSSFFL